jgi:signal transduction histidine kinase
MSFRQRVFLAFLVVLLLPLGVLAFGVRREMDRRLTAEYRVRVRSLAELVRLDLESDTERLGVRLAHLGEELAADNRFRAAALQESPGSRTWLLDWAGEAQRLTGMEYLWLQDKSGRVLSSGHFRNEFDRVEPEVPRLIAAAGPVTLLRARTAQRELLVVARIDSFQVAGRTYSLMGGSPLDAGALAPAAQARGLGVEIRLPGATPVSADAPGVADAFALPLVDARNPGEPRRGTAQIVVTQSLAPLEALRRSVDAWFLGALVATGAAALLAALWLSSRVTRPLSDLAEKSSRLDLDRLDVGFDAERTDEVGALARVLDAMAGRLRQSATRLREAERRATVGDLARQVNHDVRNGLVPLRHVLTHLGEVALREPRQLPQVFAERRSTLESSVNYLETLARNYARLSPSAGGTGGCDVNAVARDVAAGFGGRAEVRLSLAGELPAAHADTLVVRRILENLIQNGLESLDGRSGGTVTVSTGTAENGRIRMTVADTGHGMSQEQLDRVFEGFYTTKPAGTGLGLTIVRRLLQDVGGSLAVETEPGAGSRFIVELPA